ncbi:hypothetical protein AA313_de0201660 [Arthrobotrys entomopaga]|nr:hypothetical protein AA313_de0201660 [Arthrobotrys entomopaga]
MIDVKGDGTGRRRSVRVAGEDSRQTKINPTADSGDDHNNNHNHNRPSSNKRAMEIKKARPNLKRTTPMRRPRQVVYLIRSFLLERGEGTDDGLIRGDGMADDQP